MKQWLSRQRSCPVCKKDLSLVQTSQLPSLKVGSPLAWRVLSKVKIACPLQCKWEGDYYSLQSHLTSSSEHVAQTESSRKDMALALKEQANEKFASGNMKDALKLYSQAISTSDSIPELYTNRAAAYLALEDNTRALEDTKAALKLDPQSEKAWYRGAKAFIKLGKFQEGLAWVSSADGLVKSAARAKKELLDLSAKYEAAKRLVKEGKYAEARSEISHVMMVSTAPNVLQVASKCEIEAGSIERGLKLALQVLRSSTTDPSAYVSMARANLYNAQIDEAMKFVKEALRLDPDSTEAKNTFKLIKLYRDGFRRVDSYAASKDYDKVVTQLSELEIYAEKKSIPLKAKVLADRGNAYFRLQKFPEALKGKLTMKNMKLVILNVDETVSTDCSRAIYIQDDCKRAWLTKNYILLAEGKFDEAVADMERLMETWGMNDNVIKGAYEKAKFEARKAKRPNYYKILSTDDIQLSSVSSEPEIKAAYKQKALECHPDKVPAGASEEERRKVSPYG